jgi:hypothetical protein
MEKIQIEEKRKVPGKNGKTMDLGNYSVFGSKCSS